jgi:S-DNA-T family DNA segregation ATPase FtsK/SpoIIIE
MNEVYQDIVENYIPSIREGAKYGIYFIITSETQSTVKMKVVQSCKNAFCLQMANDLVYRDILGRTNGLVPSSTLGRGLCKLENVCEFQSAFVSKDESFYNYIKKFVEELNTKGMEKAPVIHVMPEIVELEPMKKKYTGLESVPIGIIKDNLNILRYNFAKKVTTVISSNEFETMERFVRNLIRVFSENNNMFMTTVIDASRFFEQYEFKTSYLNAKFNEFVDALDKANQSILDILEQNDYDYRSVSSIPNNLVVIIGFEKFYSKLDDDHKKIFQKILTSNKEEPKMNFVYFDVPGSFKKYEYEEWYKQSMDTTNAVWVGPGVGQQFLVKISNSLSSYSAIDKEHAMVVQNGNALIVKLINEIK